MFTMANYWRCLETFKAVQKFSRLSRNFSDCWKHSLLSKNFQDCQHTFQEVWKLSRLARDFLETFYVAQKLSRQSGTFFDLIHSYVDVNFMVNFVNTHKNFMDAQKLSGRKCRHAEEVFGTLLQVISTTKYLNLFFSIKNISYQDILWHLHLWC